MPLGRPFVFQLRATLKAYGVRWISHLCKHPFTDWMHVKSKTKGIVSVIYLKIVYGTNKPLKMNETME